MSDFNDLFRNKREHYHCSTLLSHILGSNALYF